MRKRCVAERIFECPECGVHLTAYKSRSFFTSEGHVKTMWCYRCRTDRNMVQLGALTGLLADCYD